MRAATGSPGMRRRPRPSPTRSWPRCGGSTRTRPEEIMAKMPAELVGPDKALYLAALKNSIPMYSTTGRMDPKGGEAVLAVFSQSSRTSRRPRSTFQDLHESVRRTGGAQARVAVVAQRRAPAGQARLCAAGCHTMSRFSTRPPRRRCSTKAASTKMPANTPPHRTCLRPAGSDSRGRGRTQILADHRAHEGQADRGVQG